MGLNLSPSGSTPSDLPGLKVSVDICVPVAGDTGTVLSTCMQGAWCRGGMSSLVECTCAVECTRVEFCITPHPSDDLLVVSIDIDEIEETIRENVNRCLRKEAQHHRPAGSQPGRRRFLCNVEVDLMLVFRSCILVSAGVIATELPCVNHEVSLASPMLKIVARKARVPDTDFGCVSQKVEVVQQLNKFTAMVRVYNFVIEARWFSDFCRARNHQRRSKRPAHVEKLRPGPFRNLFLRQQQQHAMANEVASSLLRSGQGATYGARPVRSSLPQMGKNCM